MADTRIDELRRRLERDPGSRLFAQLAEELRKAGELAEAIRVARAGLAQHASYASARLTLGRALLDSGDATGARVELESALRDAPDNILASRFLAQALEGVGELKGALVQYQKTLTMAPGDRQVQGQISALEARLRAPGAAAPPPEAATVPPTSRPTPPPLPAASGLAVPPSGEGVPRRAAAPPVRSAPAPDRAAASPPVAAAPPAPAARSGGADEAPLASGGEEDFSVQQELPPTLRIHASQAAPAPHLLQVDKVPAAAAPFRPPEPAPAPEPEPAPELREPPKQAEPATVVPSSPEGEEPAGIGGSTAPFSSSTLAELYFQQGLVDRAVDVYRQLVTQQPGNDRARSRLAELEQAEPSADARAARRQELQRTIAGLEALLAVVRRR